MVSKPRISMFNVFRSVVSALPRMEPIAFWKKPSAGAPANFCSRARRRDCLAESMSFVASSPAALRAMSASVTGRDLEPKFCQGELTLAKPERMAMKEMPITPTRERQASLML